MSGIVVPFPLTSALKPQPIKRLPVHSISVLFIVIPTANEKI